MRDTVPVVMAKGSSGMRLWASIGAIALWAVGCARGDVLPDTQGASVVGAGDLER